MILPSDVTNLVLTYATEPIYTFIPEIPKPSHQEIRAQLGTNPWASRYILKHLNIYNPHQIIANPDLRIISHTIKTLLLDGSSLNRRTLSRIYGNLLLNAPNESELIKQVETLFFSDMESALGENRNGILLRRIFSYCFSSCRSKKLFDLYAERFGFTTNDLLAMGSYLFFADLTEEENSRELLRILENIRSPTDTRLGILPIKQRTDHPIMIKELEIVCGISSEKSARTYRVHMLNPDEISRNPGAIHILQARPDLISYDSVVFNPKICTLIKSGIVKFSSINWKDLPNSRESLDLILENLDVGKLDKNSLETLGFKQDSTYSVNKFGLRLIRWVAEYLSL